MKKNRVLSALLAVMMVVSMLTCITLPAMAEQDYALTQAEAEALPSVQQAKMDDGIQAYKISSWADLIYAAASARYETTAAYQTANASDKNYAPYCYKSPAVSGQYSADNYGNPSFIDQSRFVRGDISTYDRLYLTVDLDVKDYSGPGGTGAEGFKADYDAFVAVDLAGILGANATRYQNSTLYAMIDGMGHTITGYEKDFAFIGGQFVGLLRNLTLDGAVVDSTGTGLTYAALLVKGVNCGGATLENVHIKNSTFTTDQQATGAIFVGLNSNNNRPVAFKNCSLVNSHLINTYNGAMNYGGLFVGLMASPSSGYPSTLNTLENCFVSGSSITCHSIGSAGGLLCGWVDKSSGTLGLKMDNVAVFDSEIICTNALGNGSTYASVLAAVRRVSATAANDVGNVYAGNVTITSPDPEDANKKVTTAVPNFFYDYGGNNPTFALQEGVRDGNFVSDGTITNAVFHQSTAANTFAGTTAPEGAAYDLFDAIEDMNAATAYADWGFGTNGSLKTLAADEKTPVAVSFTKKDATATYYTDVNGKIAVTSDLETVTAQDLASLTNSSWSDGTNAVEKGADWSAMTFAAATAYTKTSHDFTYTAGENNTHNVTCDLCDEHAQTGVACTPVADPENDVAATYFAKAQKAYKCEFCTNTWTEEVADSTAVAPYTIALDDTAYTGIGSEVKLTIAAKADAEISAMKLSLTVSEYLDYVDYAPAAGYMVTVNEKADGTLRVILAKENGTLLTAEDVATLTFVTKALPAGTDNATLTVDAALTEVVVGTGDATAKKDALTKTAAVSADYSVFTFVAGDVDNDDTADLLDAVLMIQKLNGTIGAAQNAAFQLIAADVNADGTVDTADIVLMLQYCTGFEVELVNATQEPTFIAVGA